MRTRPSPFRHSPLLAALMWVPLAAAQVAPALPNAGSTLRELQATEPATPRPLPDATFPQPFGTPCAEAPLSCAGAPREAGPTFVLKDIVLQGNDSIPTDTLAAQYRSALGTEVGLADLDAIAARLTQVYRDQGYVLAQVIVPAQDVTAGSVTLSVLEGRIGKVYVSVAANAPIHEPAVRARLTAIEPGQPLMQHTLERAMLLLSDLPGLRVSSSIEAGGEPGTVDLTVSVEGQPRWAFKAEVDNHGVRSTGEWRAGLTARWNAPFERGDNLDLRLLTSQRGDTAYGSIGYELPVGTQGTRLGVGVARLHYDLGQEFAALDASGTATVASISLSHPLIRSRSHSLLLRGGVDYRRLKDSIGLFDAHSRKTLTDLSVGLAYEGRDTWLGGGFSSATLTLVQGHLKIDDAADRAVDAGPGGRRTAGNSTRLVFSASRLNALAGPTTLFLGVSGQAANRNLDSAARLALGGPRAVRAYSPAEAIVDEGVVATAELRYAIAPPVTVALFYDWGTGRYNARRVAGQGDNTVTRSGAGLGVYWAAPYGVNLSGSVAWRTSGEPRASSDRRPRLFLSLSKAF